MGAEDARNDENPIDMVAREVTVLIRLAESARKGMLTLDRSAYQLLGAIAAHTPLALGTLAELLQLDVSTVSRQVAVLETKDLVERSVDRGVESDCEQGHCWVLCRAKVLGSPITSSVFRMTVRGSGVPSPLSRRKIS